MGQQFRLAVKPVVEFQVDFSTNDEGKTRRFVFTMVGERIPAEVLKTEIVDEADGLISDFLVRHLTGWRGQTLVLLEDGTDTPSPAPFSTEALQAMCGVHGLAQVIFQSYLKANSVEGKVKNSR
jgi:hypothetical protein